MQSVISKGTAHMVGQVHRVGNSVFKIVRKLSSNTHPSEVPPNSYPSIRGSNASLTPSPKRLIDNTVITIATPGYVVSHGACSM